MPDYEAPEILEIGKATALTLGAGGTQDDNCLCKFMPNEDTLL